jgi:hypothetical protein
MRRSVRVLSPSIIKVDIIHSEVLISKWRVRWHGIPGRSRARETRFERGCYNHHAEEDIVDATSIVSVASRPGEAHAVAGCIFGGGCLAEEGYWARAGYVYLLGVGTF